MTPEDFWEANDADTVVNDILPGATMADSCP